MDGPGGWHVCRICCSCITASDDFWDNPGRIIAYLLLFTAEDFLDAVVNLCAEICTNKCERGRPVYTSRSVWDRKEKTSCEYRQDLRIADTVYVDNF